MGQVHLNSSLSRCLFRSEGRLAVCWQLRARHCLKATEQGRAGVVPASAVVPLPALACGPVLVVG